MPLSLIAQKTYVLGDAHKFTVAGTSTLHDWEMISSEASGKAQISIVDNRLEDIKGMKISLPSTTLVSGKKGMDKNAYKALKTEEYPEIVFQLAKVGPIASDHVNLKGKLTIAGVTNDIALKVSYELAGEGITFLGTYPTQFSAYDIEPPKALLGTIKTGNDLDISFRTSFNLK